MLEDRTFCCRESWAGLITEFCPSEMNSTGPNIFLFVFTEVTGAQTSNYPPIEPQGDVTLNRRAEKHLCHFKRPSLSHVLSSFASLFYKKNGLKKKSSNLRLYSSIELFIELSIILAHVDFFQTFGESLPVHFASSCLHMFWYIIFFCLRKLKGIFSSFYYDDNSELNKRKTRRVMKIFLKKTSFFTIQTSTRITKFRHKNYLINTIHTYIKYIYVCIAFLWKCVRVCKYLYDYMLT